MNTLEEPTVITQATPSGNGNGNGNGHPPNGNGHSNGENKKFRIVREQDEDITSIAPRLRYQVQTDGELTDGAKVLYCFLSDQSFLRSVSPHKGVVTMSKLKLAEHLKVSVRSVARHGRELEARRFLWTRIFWKGGFELTNWYLRGLADSQSEMWDDADPSWGRTRIRGRRSRPVTRGSNGQFCPYGDETPEIADLLEKTVVDGQPCPGATVKIDRCQRTAVTVVNGQPCPVSTDSRDRCQRTAVTVVNGQPCPSSTDRIDRSQRSGLAELEDTPSVKGVEESQNLNVQRVNAFRGSNEKAAKKIAAVNGFLLEISETMDTWKPGSGKRELANSGAAWRKLFNQDPDKVRRVWADIRAGVKEGRRFSNNPAAAAMDLYKRLPD